MKWPNPVAVNKKHRWPASGGGGGSAYDAAVILDAPLAFYPMKEATGPVVTDLSGNGRTATVTGAPTFGRPGPCSDGETAIGGFSAGNVIIIPGLVSLPIGSPVTIEYWEKPPAAVASSLFSIGGQANPQLCSANSPWSDGTLYWDYGDNTGGGRLSIPYGTVNVWRHVVLTADGTIDNRQEIYLDGALAASTVLARTSPTVTLSGGFIGRDAAGSNFQNGDVAKFAVYNYRLSAARVAAHYAAR